MAEALYAEPSFDHYQVMPFDEFRALREEVQAIGSESDAWRQDFSARFAEIPKLQLRRRPQEIGNMRSVTEYVKAAYELTIPEDRVVRLGCFQELGYMLVNENLIDGLKPKGFMGHHLVHEGRVFRGPQAQALFDECHKRVIHRFR